MTIKLTENEDKIILIDVDNPDGTAKNITGGTLTAVARSPGGSNKTLTVVITDAAAGKVTITIPKDTINVPGSWFGQCDLEIGTGKTTIWQEVILARRSVI